MKTTLTLEDVERLEELFSQKGESFSSFTKYYDFMDGLLPLILPVIREHVGSPKDIHPPQGGTSAHHGSHSDSGQSKAAASQIITGIECDQNHGRLSLSDSQKTAQEGSVCEVEPLGEVHRNLAGFTYIVLNPVDGDQWMLEAQGDCIGFGPVMSLNYFYRNHVSSLVSHLTAWLNTGSFDLKGLPSSPPSSEDTELPPQPE